MSKEHGSFRSFGPESDGVGESGDGCWVAWGVTGGGGREGEERGREGVRRRRGEEMEEEKKVKGTNLE